MTCGLYRWSRHATLATAACFAMAIDAPQIGVQALGSWPTGSMRSAFTNNNGYGAGVFAAWEVGPGKVLRLGYDGIWYSNSSRAAQNSGIPVASLKSVSEGKSRSHAVTAQYLYFPSGDDEGLYFKVGAGAMNYLTRSKDTVTFQGAQPTTLTTLQETGVHLACLAGLGYECNRNWGVSAQYSFITVNARTLGAVQTGVSYRF